MNVRFIIYFDIDDTLLDHRQAERRALADLRRAFPEAFDHCTDGEVQRAYHRHNKRLWERYAHGEIDKSTLKHLRFEKLLKTLAVEGLEAEALGEHYLRRYAEHWAFTEGARCAFHTLADAFPVGLLTNGFSETQRAKLRRFPALRRRSDTVVISEEVGYMKPHPEILAHATEEAGVSASAILYVGNSYSSDVKGGCRAGWQVAWYAANGQADEAHAADDSLYRFQAWDELTERLC